MKKAKIPVVAALIATVPALAAGCGDTGVYSAPLYFSLKDANYKTLCSISVRPHASYKETAENSAA